MAITVRMKIIIVLGVGVVLCASGVFMYLWMPGYINRKIATKMALNADSESFENWRKTPVPIYLSVFLFNVTNPTEFLRGDEKAKLHQMGPYNFLQFREKTIQKWDNEEDTVSFTQVKRFYFDEESSIGDLSDNITLLNVPLAGFAQNVMSLSGMQKFMINAVLMMNKAYPFVFKTVGEVLFEGYYDELFAMLSRRLGKTLLPNDTFGLFYGQNDTNDGVYVVNRGNVDIELFNNIESWNNDSILDYWGTTYCNEIKGTDGSMFPPNVKPEDKLNMFTTELCRSAFMEYEGTVITRGIKNLRYSPSESMLESPRISEENRCYCLLDNVSECLGSGVLNISVCKKGAPIFISLPHFFQADDEYIYAVDGMSPDEAVHKTYVDVEPLTGIVMNASKKLQINVMMYGVKGLSGYDKINSTIFPVMWVNESAAINVESSDKFKRQLQTPILLGKAAMFALMGTGCFLVLCIFIYVICLLLKRRKPSSSNGQVNTNNVKLGMKEMNEKSPATEKLISQTETTPHQ